MNDGYNIAVKAGKLSTQPLMNYLGLDALIRVSFCYFNTRQEVDLLVSAIKEFISRHEE